MAAPPLVILGCGFTGLEVARRARSRGSRVIATTRSPDKMPGLVELGIEARLVSMLDADLVGNVLPAGADVLVALPPDGTTDAEIAPALRSARHVVYISTTGVFGAARGHVDESTPVDPSEPRARVRLEAEGAYLAAGATILRAAGIYGPGRGLHRRLLAGDFRVPDDGSNVVSRIHVADLASLVLAAMAAPLDRVRGEVFVVADDAPVPQIEVIRWLCARLDLPLPAALPIREVAPTLRHDRAVDNTRIKRALSSSLAYPSYREGFEACITAEGVNPRG